MMFDYEPHQNPTESSAESTPSPQMDASTSAFLADGRTVDGPCLNEDIPPYHAPTPAPEGRVSQAQLVDAQLASAQLVSNTSARLPTVRGIFRQPSTVPRRGRRLPVTSRRAFMSCSVWHF
jgi:hypothetical protein